MIHVIEPVRETGSCFRNQQISILLELIPLDIAPFQVSDRHLSFEILIVTAGTKSMFYATLFPQQSSLVGPPSGVSRETIRAVETDFFKHQ